MEKSREFLLFLSLFDFTHTKFQQIVDFMGDDLSITKFCKKKFPNEILTKEQYEKMVEKADAILINNYDENLKDKDIFLITKLDEEYPEKLRVLPDSPFFLFCKGDLSLLGKKSLSVVGTRKPSNYGRITTNKLVGDIAKEGIVIISGLAYGIDSIAHKRTLEVSGKTIAVLGSGFNYIYPSEHTALAKEIVDKGGLLISEYQPSKKSTKYTFPQRNRIIAGLADGVLITEAGLKSGTIHTKDFALEYGKNMYAVPGNIDNELSTLTNDLIKSGQAATVTCAQDILSDYKIEKSEKNEAFFNYSIEEQMIINLLKKGQKEIDEIAKETKLDINILNSYLTSLEISGIIERLPGNFIALS